MDRDSRWIWTVGRVLVLVALVSGCATTPPVPKSDLPVLIDPRLGYEGESKDSIDRKFSAAWNKLVSGQLDAADKSFTSLSAKNPRYAPATLGRAVVALAKAQLEFAERYVEKATDPGSDYFAAEAYRGEIALARGLTEDAYRNYERIAVLPGAPVVVTTRFEIVADAWFDELVARANAADSDEVAIELLKEAVMVRPRSDSIRIALAKRLVKTAQYDLARVEIETLLDRGLVENPDVQLIIANLEAAEGRYQDAIVRLERLSSRYPDRGYERRLAEVKLGYMRANLPPRYHRAVASQAITRADLAVLAYWHVSAVRFTRVTEPPIAVDIAGAPGRDEIVKALGLGLLSVDRATRLVGPDATVTASAFLRVVFRIQHLGPAPECAVDRSGADALAACGVDVTGFLEDPGAVVSGANAIAVLSALDDLLESAK